MNYSICDTHTHTHTRERGRGDLLIHS